MIVGHHKQLKVLESIADGKMHHHGFLFYGPESIGKRTIAEAFASGLIFGEKCAWEHSQQFNNDLHIIAPRKIEKKGVVTTKDISIDQILDAKKNISLAADHAGKVLIVDDAHRMTVSAQNALLKTLEEPTKNTFIVLVTHNPKSLLQTISSRCFDIEFGTVDNADLLKMGDDQERVDAAQGRPGYLKKIIDDEKFYEAILESRKSLQELFAKPLHERMTLAADLAKRDEFYLDVFFTVWTYRIYHAAHNSKKYQLLRVADRVEEVVQKIQKTNVNKQLIIEDLLINIV